MFFKMNRLSLIDEINKCNRIVDIKSVLSYATHIFVECDNDCVSFTSLNSHMTIKTKIFSGECDLKFKESGSFLIRGKYILEILRRMDDEIVTITKSDDNIISLYGNKSEFFLNILDASEFPLLAFKDKGQIINVNSSSLKETIAQTIISVDETNQKLILTGLNLSIKNNSMFVTGTDGFRVSRKEIYIEEDIKDIEINIPYKTILELQKLLDRGICKISLLDNTCCFTINNTLLQTNILEGQYPNVVAVFPEDFSTKIIVDNKKIFKLISRADIPKDDAYDITVVNIQIYKEKIIIKSNIQQIASFEEEFSDFSLDGIEEQNIYLNSKFLLDSLKSFETKTIEIRIIDEKKPIVICSSEQINLKQIILPMSSN